MARLPSKNDLSGPASLRSGRMISSADMSGLARGVASLGNSLSAIGAERAKEDNLVDVARAEADYTTGLLTVQNEFDQDGDYSTFQQRAPQKTKAALDKSASLIRDPVMRERWAAGALDNAARINDTIFDKATGLRKQANTNALDEALEANRRIYVDPATSEEDKKKARADIEGAIGVAGEIGLLTPDGMQARKDLYINGADVNRAMLEAQTNPGTFIGGGFEASLVKRESGGRANVINPWGYAGLYQFGAPRMADLGIYDPEGENLGGWSKRKGAQGKWTGTFNIPGHPEVKKIGDFLANPAAQKAAFEVHRAKMDSEIKERGLENFIGQTVGGVNITRDGIHAMMHLGGAGGAAKALKSGGAVNAADANGTTLLAYAKMGAGGNDSPGYFANLSPEDRFKVQKAAEAEQNRRSVEMRSGIDVIVANAPTAILNTGEYSGQMPGPEQFFAAYGPQEGAERYNQFQSSVQTAEQAHGMKTMSADQISAMVNEAAPTSSGNDAAMQSKRYETLSAAAKATLEAREKDPAVYANSAFPSVAKAWQSARNIDGSLNPAGLQAGIAASVAAQQQMGVANIAPLPKAFAEGAVKTFKDDTLPGQDRIAAVSDILMATPDPMQRKAIFNQMVDAGLPDVTEGAFAALERGDKGAADRLFQAAIVDVAKLPGKAANTPAQIDEQIQADLMEEGKVGDVYYGLRDGTIENMERAQRDARLLNNAVNIRVRNGETLQSATAMAAKDLFGEVKAVTGDGRVNAQIILPQEEDESLILDGLAGLMPEVEKALTANVLPDAPAEAGAKAIISAATQNHNRNILSEGFFRSVDEGFVFIDPYDGTAIEGPDGNPVVFTRDQVLSAKPALPELLPTDQSRTMGDNVQTEMQMQEERVRKMYEGDKPAVDPDGFPVDLSRAKIQNDDGSFSTEETATVEIDGRWVNVPTIWDGKRLDEDAAVERARSEIGKGVVFPNYDTLKDAESGARRRSDYLGKLREAK